MKRITGAELSGLAQDMKDAEREYFSGKDLVASYCISMDDLQELHREYKDAILKYEDAWRIWTAQNANGIEDPEPEETEAFEKYELEMIDEEITATINA